MEWSQVFGADKQPSSAQLAEFIGSPLWRDLNAFLQENYEIDPVCNYSTCTGQPGWNVKYQKAGRSLCTLYPMSGIFIALVVIGAKEQAEAEFLMPTFGETVQGLYANSVSVAGGRWLMIPVTDDKTLDDVKQLIQTRRKIKKRT